MELDLRILLMAAGAELDSLRVSVRDLGALAAECGARLQPAERAEVLIRAQAADAVDQTLDALAGVLARIAAGASAPAAVAPVTLQAVADRLSGRPTYHMPDPDGPPPGEVSLFE